MFQKLLFIVAGLVSATTISSAGAEAVFASHTTKDIDSKSAAIALVSSGIAEPEAPVEAAIAQAFLQKPQEEDGWIVDSSTPALQVHELATAAPPVRSVQIEQQGAAVVNVHELIEHQTTPLTEPLAIEPLAIAISASVSAGTTAPIAIPAVHSLQAGVGPIAATQQPEFEIPAGYTQLSNGVYVPTEWGRHTPIAARDRTTHHRSSGAGSEVIAGETRIVSSTAMNSEPRTTSVTSVIPATTVAVSTFPIYPLPRITAITSLYGMRGGRLHEGIDFAVPVGTPVLAALPGRVATVQWLDGYGLTVILEHTNGTTSTLYAHLSRALVTRGMQVQQGQAIALSGNTGRSTGPHLHFEIQERIAGGWRAINLNNIVRHSQRLKEQGTQIALAGAVTTPPDHAAIMRVAVAVDASALAIAGSHGLILRSSRGESLGTLPQMQNFSVSPLSGALMIGDRSGSQNIPQMFFAEPAQPGGLVAVNGRWYRGRVLVGMRSGGLIAVNWVGMEDYLKSVVGSEMIPGWPVHALKAQAIAARSYALAHRLRPANHHWFDLLSTPRHQAYRGVEAETRSTHQAVALTRGMILAPTPAFMQQYQVHAVNGVVEALYASTQEIVDEVHNGFGLSQWGAASLAQRGDSYLRILGFYYPETAIVRIY